MAILSGENLYISYEAVSVIEDISLSIPEGKVTILIGANGCGKSTLLKSLSRLIKPTKGMVYLDGKEIHKQSSKDVAKKLGILPQGPQAPAGLTVKELCHYGRHPHKTFLSKPSREDDETVRWSLEATGMLEFKDRPLEALSGGHRQRAWISMALAQGTDLLLLDEPTTYLDLAHQIEVLELLKELNENFGRTIVMVLHDLNQAARYADHLISIAKGKIYKEGKAEDIFTEKMILDVFGLECCIIKDPVVGKLMCVPTGRRNSKKKVKSVS